MKKMKNILLATMMTLLLAMSFSMIVSADYIDTTGPTGEYYQYASFTKGDGSGYLGGGDVDSYGDLIYVNRDGDHLDVYQVTLLDSDLDGVLEPDQHPDNPDATGPMEQRTLTYLRTYDVPDLDGATWGEIYAASDGVYFLGEDKGDIYQYVFASGTTSKVVDSPSYKWLAVLGYDDVNDKWYAAPDSSSRDIYSWDGTSWQFEFSYASLAGNHMDGLEVVTDPNTGIPYVYVSDMTSDYIGQWRYDSATASWVEENLFNYSGTAGDVEGMGFGALGHFWATTGFSNQGTLYEIGGGELGGYVPHLTLAPVTASNYVGEIHTLTATLTVGGDPVSGETITFTVTTGPHIGETGTDVTNDAGEATWSYMGTAVGTDTIVATGAGKTSNEVTKIWTGNGAPEFGSLAVLAAILLSSPAFAYLMAKKRYQ